MWLYVTYVISDKHINITEYKSKIGDVLSGKSSDQYEKKKTQKLLKKQVCYIVNNLTRWKLYVGNSSDNSFDSIRLCLTIYVV